MDLRLQNNTVFQIVGPSGSGKTYFVSNLLTNANAVFLNKIGKIYWLMGIAEGEHGLTRKALKHVKNITFLDGFEEGWETKPRTGDVIVIDDLFAEAVKERSFNNLFTKIARHRGVTVIFITQNLFHQGGQHRTRNLNVHYLVLFKNPRDNTIIDFVARQAFPNNRKFLMDAFQDATHNKPHGYLFLDFTQTCFDEIRVRTDIFKELYVHKQL